MIMGIFRAKSRRGRREVCKNLNVNEEYLSALRTKSYGDFFNKAQVLVEQQESNRCFRQRFSEVLLEPAQDSISAILESAILSQLPELKALMLNYFDISAEASNFCCHLLTNIHQISHDYEFIQRAVNALDGYYFPPDNDLILRSIFSELDSFTILENPFSDFEKRDFKVINDKYSSVLHHLKSKRKKVARKMKMMDHINKASGICATTIIGLVAITAMFITAHAFIAILMVPSIFVVPNIRFLKTKKKIFGFRRLRRRFLRKIREQLDLAARGTYIVNRDFDTMNRLVGRLHAEVEDKREMIRTCLERREDMYCMHVVIKELKKGNHGFRKQVQELEEHVYLCLVTINRARALVIKEIKMVSCTCKPNTNK